MKYLIAVCCSLSLLGLGSAKEHHHDLVIYGGTSAGIAAAIQASRMDLSVVIIEPTHRLGGLTTGGLGQTDIGNKQVIGGISREFYQAVRRHYENPANWRWQKREDYQSGGQSKTMQGEDTKWTFEPSAAMTVYARMIEDEKITIGYGQRLNREDGVKMESGRIISIGMESGEFYSGRMFIDATYEGDLLAAAGVSYTVGREANRQYGESLNGVQDNLTAESLTGTVSRNAKNHNFVEGQGLIDGGTGGADFGNFTPDSEGPQAYGFRYTNSGLTSAAGVIGSLSAGTTITISFDVFIDGFNGGSAYEAYLTTFDGGRRSDLDSAGAIQGTTSMLAKLTGNAASGDYQTVSFSYTVGDDVWDADGEGGVATSASANQAFNSNVLGHDIAIRFKGATSYANIDNVSVSIVPEPQTALLSSLGLLALLLRRR